MLLRCFALVMLIWSASACAQSYYSEDCCTDCCTECCTECCGFDVVATLDIGGGYRQDNLKWAFPGFSPGVAIHKKWKDINIGMIEANARLLACQSYLLKIDFDYGWFGDQKKNDVTIIDFNSDEVAKHHFKARGSVYDISGGIGYQFNWCCDTISFAPLVGWSYYHQTIKSPPFFAEHYHCYKTAHKKSTYYWNGPWVGFETAYRWDCDWLFYLSYEFHGAYFHANMKDFFRHQARNKKALGNEVEVGAAYQFCDCWLLGLKFNYKGFWVNKTNSTSDEFDGESHSRRIEWDSYFVTLDVGYSF